MQTTSVCCSGGDEQLTKHSGSLASACCRVLVFWCCGAVVLWYGLPHWGGATCQRGLAPFRLGSRRTAAPSASRRIGKSANKSGHSSNATQRNATHGDAAEHQDRRRHMFCRLCSSNMSSSLSPLHLIRGITIHILTKKQGSPPAVTGNGPRQTIDRLTVCSIISETLYTLSRSSRD